MHTEVNVYITLQVSILPGLKVERSFETFCKLKWHKVKKQLPLIYMETFLSILRPKTQPLLHFSDTSGYTLLKDA